MIDEKKLLAWMDEHMDVFRGDQARTFIWFCDLKDAVDKGELGVSFKHPLTKEECVKIGGHCYVQDQLVLMSNPPRYTRTCKHCGHRQISVPITEEDKWRDY
jgi:hypothetical protein